MRRGTGNKFLISTIASIFLLLCAGIASATISAGFVNYQAQADFQQYYSQSDLGWYWPVLTDKEDCKARQDVILNVAPGGCQPMVVRSDLLADQNVPVFCQIDMLQLNPLIDIKRISNIVFTGGSSKYIVGTGFHPARAALRTRDTLLGSPIQNNIGYVVVVLKRNPNEKELPDFVGVNLSAQIHYEAGNALGVGRAEFIAEPMTDEQWESEKENKQGFWRGKYFVRVNQIEGDYVTVSLYFGDRVISTVKVKKGELSREIYFPGSYCMAAVQISYDGIETSKQRAVIEVSDGEGSDVSEVLRGSKFLNDQCTIENMQISADKNTGNVTVNCGGTGKRFILSLTPRISSFQIGNEVILSGANVNDVWTIKGVNPDGTYLLSKSDGSTKDNVKAEQIALKNPVLSDYSYQKSPTDTAGKKIDEAFKQAIDDYERVANDYPAEKKANVENAVLYGEKALDEAIILAMLLNKQQTKARLLNKIIELYPNSETAKNYNDELFAIYKKDSAAATASVEINGRIWVITLKSFKAPKSGEEPYVKVFWNANEYQLKENEKAVNVGSSTYISLEKINSISEAKVVANCQLADGKTQTESIVLRTGQEAVKVCGGRGLLRLSEVNAREAARIRILPKTLGTETRTNLTVNIGIEKRAIKLSPSKTKEMIENLNKSIEKWDRISERLGKAVETMKTACLATAAALTVKNFISGISGETLARQQTMTGPNGWTQKCRDMVAQQTKGSSGEPYSTVTKCLNGESALINQEISDRQSAIKSVNTRISAVESTSGVTSGNLLTGKSTDSALASKEYYNRLKEVYGTRFTSLNLPAPRDDGNNPYTYQQLRDIDYSLQLSGKYGSTQDLTATQQKITESQKLMDEIKQAADATKSWQSMQPAEAGFGVRTSAVGSVASIENLRIVDEAGVLPKDATSAMFVNGVKKGATSPTVDKYLLVGTKEGNVFNPLAAYKYYDSGEGRPVLGAIAYSDMEQFRNDYGISTFEDKSSALSGNKMSGADLTVRYFGTGPDKDLASIVPFDVANGWYAKIESSLGIGNQVKAYDSSGMPKSWHICNVGVDKRVDTTDKCQLYIEGSNVQNILDQGSTKSLDLIRKSREAIREANSKASAGAKEVTILGQKLLVGAPMSHISSAAECQEVMSISDCNILFNVCDPVICPPSRCDLAGKWPVADVIQQGIIGSAVLCLHNFGNPTEGGVLIPVCLSGINAGVDNWISILKGHRDCLQASLDNGQMMGICDQMYSIYTCDFFWRQVGPIANQLIPTLISVFTGGGTQSRGGGEYLNTLAAWNNVQSSITYVTQIYGVNSFKAFQARSIEEVGSEFCKAYISAKGPTVLKSLTEVESPPQFNAWFSTIKYSDATIPATSQYKVFYHIFAGKNAGTYYSVYLKNPPSSPYYSYSAYIQVASGFINKGDYASETKDFTAPEGYQELCVRINAEEECGFKQVSTSFAVNYVRDQYVSGQLEEKDIITESGCISGSPSVSSLGALASSGLNIQAGVEEAAMPQISSRGIVRVCASTNPAQTIDPARYVEVGYCGNKNIKCWLDTRSVDNAITDNNLGLKNATLSQLESANSLLLAGRGQVIINETLAAENLDTMKQLKNDIVDNYISDEVRVKDFKSRVDALVEKLVINAHKAELWLIWAEVEDAIALDLFEKMPKANVAAPAVTEKAATPTTPAVSPKDEILSLLTDSIKNIEPVEIELNDFLVNKSEDYRVTYLKDYNMKLDLSANLKEMIDAQKKAQTEYSELITKIAQGQYILELKTNWLSYIQAIESSKAQFDKTTNTTMAIEQLKKIRIYLNEIATSQRLAQKELEASPDVTTNEEVIAICNELQLTGFSAELPSDMRDKLISAGYDSSQTVKEFCTKIKTYTLSLNMDYNPSRAVVNYLIDSRDGKNTELYVYTNSIWATKSDVQKPIATISNDGKVHIYGELYSNPYVKKEFYDYLNGATVSVGNKTITPA